MKGKLDGKSKLKTLCATRWFSRANALATIKASVPVIVSNLEYLQTNDGKSGVHLSAIWLFLPLVVCSHILQTVAPITVTLQSSTSWDLIDVCEWMSNLDLTFWDWEKWNQLVYNTWWSYRFSGAMLCCLVQAGRQRNRANSQVADNKDYWRIILYY